VSFATPQHFLVCIIDGKSSAIDPSNVRLWHKADMLNALTNVRFEGNNGHDADVTGCLLMTQSRHHLSPAQGNAERTPPHAVSGFLAPALVVGSMQIR